jgi:hypothetical protein
MRRTIFEVERSGESWVLRHQETGTEQLFPTRDAAIASGREACQANIPSRLRVRKAGEAGAES